MDPCVMFRRVLANIAIRYMRSYVRVVVLYIMVVIPTPTKAKIPAR